MSGGGLQPPPIWIRSVISWQGPASVFTHELDVCDIFLLTNSDFWRMFHQFAEKDPES